VDPLDLRFVTEAKCCRQAAAGQPDATQNPEPTIIMHGPFECIGSAILSFGAWSRIPKP